MHALKRTRLTREESKEQTRQRLLDAAWSEVAKHGLAAASVRDIAEAAGYSQGAFYSNFDSKEALTLELLRRSHGLEAERMLEILDEAGSDPHLAMELLDAWATQPALDTNASMLTVELPLHAKRNAAFAVAFDALMRDHKASVGLFMDRIFKMHGVKPALQPEVLAHSMMALSRGLTLIGKPNDVPNLRQTLLVFLRAMLASGERV